MKARNHLFYNHYDEVYGGYDWKKYKPNNKLCRCRTDQEADRDGACKKCRFDAKCHFMVSKDGRVFTKLCTVDIIRYRPIDFKMEIFGASRKHEQLKLKLERRKKH